MRDLEDPQIKFIMRAVEGYHVRKNLVTFYSTDESYESNYQFILSKVV